MGRPEESKNCKVEPFSSGPHPDREQMVIRIKYQEQSSELRDSVYMLRGGEPRADSFVAKRTRPIDSSDGRFRCGTKSTR